MPEALAAFGLAGALGLVGAVLALPAGSDEPLDPAAEAVADLPGYVSTVLTFDEDSRSHIFDLVVPVTQDDYEAGYDECCWSTGGR